MKGFVMRIVEPKVFLVGETRVVEEGLNEYLAHIGVPEWTSDATSDAEKLVEVYSRACYNSYKPGLNPNVARVREGNKPHLAHILEVKHGSVTEHASVNFMFADVSRVFTHELVRHRVGVGISQESLRFVRLENIGFWAPTVIRESPEAMEIFTKTVEHLERLQLELANLFELDDSTTDFTYKKTVTSAMRRIAPIGLATRIGWTADFRTLRHVLEMRTDPSAEEEIRLIFGKVGGILTNRYPNMFGDYKVEMVNGLPHYTTPNQKV